MIVILKKNADPEQLDAFRAWLKSLGLDTHLSIGEQHAVMGLVGDTSQLDIETVASLDIVERVQRVQEPYKKANRKFHEEDTVIDVGGVKIGGGHFQVIAGPCSVESEEQIIDVAQRVKAAGATILRGGAFKPRTSPYAFQGLKGEGLKMLVAAKKAVGMPIVTELMDATDLDLFEDVDIIQIGARNMQNFSLLRHVGELHKPILLKRGLSNTLEELLMSAEYIMAGGNEQVILCERGIRTFETATRNTFDLSAMPVLRAHSHLPVCADPSHATGHASLVPAMALAAVAAGADCVMVEVHNDPAHALCDGPQSLTPAAFAELMPRLKAVREAVTGTKEA